MMSLPIFLLEQFVSRMEKLIGKIAMISWNMENINGTILRRKKVQGLYFPLKLFCFAADAGIVSIQKLSMFCSILTSKEGIN